MIKIYLIYSSLPLFSTYKCSESSICSVYIFNLFLKALYRTANVSITKISTSNTSRLCEASVKRRRTCRTWNLQNLKSAELQLWVIAVKCITQLGCMLYKPEKIWNFDDLDWSKQTGCVKSRIFLNLILASAGMGCTN